MSFTKVIPYFRAVMTSLQHTEWKEALDDTNIPSTLIDRAFHILPTQSTPVKQNIDLIEVDQGVAVKLYVKGYKETALGRDKALGYKEAVIRKALEDLRRTNASSPQLYGGLKNVLYAGGDITELSADNDNILRVTMNFTCKLMLKS